MNKKYDEDTKAILARREAFVKSVLSKNEIDSAKGGNNICVIVEPCLSIEPPVTVDPCLIQPCLSILPPDEVN
jgi:hypothetical protein